MKLVVSPAAETDLLDIAFYIAVGDPERALAFVAELEAACAILIDHPHAGAARPDIGDGIRSKPYRRYIVYYRISGDEVRIERFLHSARDSRAFDA